MSYRIDFKGRDAESMIVDTPRGDKIKELVFDGRRDTPIEIDGDMFLIGNIKAVVQIPDPRPKPLPNFEQSRLGDNKPKCHGQYSIQAEINRIAKDEGGRGWAKLITDKAWREDTRQKLCQDGVVWCDYRENKCACE